jgi:hypothetical protein
MYFRLFGFSVIRSKSLRLCVKSNSESGFRLFVQNLGGLAALREINQRIRGFRVSVVRFSNLYFQRIFYISLPHQLLKVKKRCLSAFIKTKV